MIISFENNELKIIKESDRSTDKKSRKKGKSLLKIPSDFCVIDLETTGLDTTFDEIIEISSIRVRNGEITDTYSELVKPCNKIDSFIEELTGITNEMVSNAGNIETILPGFLQFVGDDILVGHNVNFDINFIYDNTMEITGKPFSSDFVDTMRIARKVLPELEHHRLKDLVEHFGLSNKNAHRALSDCQATFEVLKKLEYLIKENNIDLNALSYKNKNKHFKVSEITTENTEFDESHPLFNKNCVFTGTLEKMSRKEAAQKAVDLGAKCSDSVTKKTSFLILGNFDYSSGVKGNKSTKLKKAEKLILEGQDITILSENAFYEMINN